MTSLLGTAPTGLIAGVLLLVSALVFPPDDPGARSLGNVARSVQLASLSVEPQCDDGHLFEENAVEPGTGVESHGIIFEFLPSIREAGATSLVVTLAHRNGEPVSGALVFATIRMPAMDHGLSAYPARETTAGRYHMDNVSLGMAGEWLVNLEVIRQARAPAVATFRVEVSEAQRGNSVG